MATEHTLVYLGNRNAVQVLQDPESGAQTRSPLPGNLCTTVGVPADWPLMDAARAITDSSGVWQAHSDDDAPAWVAATDPALAQMLASHYGCELREPEPAEEV